MRIEDLVFVGLKSQVVALRRSDGTEVWSTRLKGTLSMGDRFVTLLVDRDRVFAHTKGELFCLDAVSGSVIWTHDLAGLGYDIASIATAFASTGPGIAAKRRSSEGGGDAGAGDGGDGGGD
jgi:outer membrane protein assembly factor BamB